VLHDSVSALFWGATSSSCERTFKEGGNQHLWRAARSTRD
jgi:hypothetical protein